MKARRLPGVRCSTLNTECRSLLCLMIIPGRSWVAGIDICGNALLLGFAACLSEASQQETTHQCYRPEIDILYGLAGFGNSRAGGRYFNLKSHLFRGRHDDASAFFSRVRDLACSSGAPCWILRSA